jgi:Ca2+-binding RTX toxin-like protein
MFACGRQGGGRYVGADASQRLRTAARQRKRGGSPSFEYGGTVRTSAIATLLSGVVVIGIAGAAPASAATTCHGEPATIVGTTGRDVLQGTNGRDVIAGLGGGDKIFGAGGDDVICGGSGADQIRGNAGSDLIAAGSGADDVRGYRGVDQLEGGTGRDRLLGGADDDVIEDSGFGPDWIDGEKGYDFVSDRINWGDGHVVNGGAGQDYLLLHTDQTGHDARRRGRTDLRSGVTVIFERPRIHASILGFEEVALPQAPWSVYGSGAAETVYSADFLYGHHRFGLDARMRGGNDVIYGTVKKDVFFGGAGHDTVHDYGGVDVCHSIEVKRGHGKTACDR